MGKLAPAQWIGEQVHTVHQFDLEMKGTGH